MMPEWSGENKITKSVDIAKCKQVFLCDPVKRTNDGYDVFVFNNILQNRHIYAYNIGGFAKAAKCIVSARRYRENRISYRSKDIPVHKDLS